MMRSPLEEQEAFHRLAVWIFCGAVVILAGLLAAEVRASIPASRSCGSGWVPVRPSTTSGGAGELHCVRSWHLRRPE